MTELHELLQNLTDGYYYPFMSTDTWKEIDRRLKILEAVYNDAAVSFSLSFKEWLDVWAKELNEQ